MTYKEQKTLRELGNAIRRLDYLKKHHIKGDERWQLENRINNLTSILHDICNQQLEDR